MKLVRPTREHLGSYIDALTRGWSADNTRPVEAGREELAEIAKDGEAFFDGMEDVQAKGRPRHVAKGGKLGLRYRVSLL